MERRKEFNAKYCLAQDLIRSGFMEDHITHNYPNGQGYPNTIPLVQDDWQTNRVFDCVPAKMNMPIPTEELLKNKLCDQNETYK
ncbi:MAG: RagB/SusD family nutrient uptake outer membrane protein [Prolixibacteraceae bacterium]